MKMDLIEVEKLLACLVLVMALGVAVIVPGQSASASNIVVTLLNQDPNPARAGDTVDLRFKIENIGDIAANNLNIELVQDYPFTVVSGQAVQKIESLNAFQSGNNYVSLQYTVKIDKDVTEGTRQLQLKYTNPAGGGLATPSFGISIVNKVFAQISAVDKAKLEPGKETEMRFTITNAGNAPLQNMVFSWQEPNGVILPIYSSDTKYIKYLDAGQSVDVVYNVTADINADPGLYQLNLNLRFETLKNTSASTISTKTGIFVGGGTDFEVAFSESSGGQTSLSIANIGNNPAQSVSVSIPRQAAFMVTGASSAIVGNLDKGEYTIVSFQVAQANNVGNFSGQQNNRGTPSGNFSGGRQWGAGGMPDNNGLKVTISYTDTAGERKNVDKFIPIQFRASAGTTTGQFGSRAGTQTTTGFVGSTGFWALAIIVVVAGGVLILRNKGILFKKT